MNHDHPHIIITPRPTDFFQGINSPIQFKAVVANGDWSPYLPDRDPQKINGFETEECVPFSEVQSVEMQLDCLYKTGQLPQAHLDFLKTNGYFDTTTDTIHLSERYIAKLDGTTQSGTSGTAPWDAMRKYGLLPWTDWPFDSTITTWEQLMADIPPQLISKAQQFLNYFTIQYHWIIQNGGAGTNKAKVMAALPQAPVCVGGPACEPWDQLQPPICPSLAPEHMTTIFKADNNFNYRFDHYDPYIKQFPWQYNTPFMIQGVVTALPPAPPPPLPPQPTVPQEQTWLSQLVDWLTSLLSQIKGRNFGSETSNKMSANVKGVLHGIVSLGGNVALFELVPDPYRAYVVLAFNLVQVVYAYLDPTYAVHLMGKQS